MSIASKLRDLADELDYGTEDCAGEEKLSENLGRAVNDCCLSGCKVSQQPQATTDTLLVKAQSIANSLFRINCLVSNISNNIYYKKCDSDKGGEPKDCHITLEQELVIAQKTADQVEMELEKLLTVVGNG